MAGEVEQDFFSELSDLLLDEAEATEDKVADIENAEPGEESEEANTVTEDDEVEVEEKDKPEKDEENLGIRFKKAKEKEKKLEAEINALKAELKKQQEEKVEEEEFLTDDEKANSERDKQIESLKSEIETLKLAKQSEKNKAIENEFFKAHPELADEKVAYKKKMEKFLKEHTGIFADVSSGKLGLEQVHLLMGGKPKSVVADARKVFGSTGSEPSNPRITPTEKSAYDKALDMLDKGVNEIPGEDFELARDEAIKGVAGFFFNS
jgi:hypothetical protein